VKGEKNLSTHEKPYQRAEFHATLLSNVSANMLIFQYPQNSIAIRRFIQNIEYLPNLKTAHFIQHLSANIILKYRHAKA
jgi:hypothetical protein